MSDSERNLLKEKQSRIVNRVRCNVRRMPMLNRHLANVKYAHSSNPNCHVCQTTDISILTAKFLEVNRLLRNLEKMKILIN